MTWQLVIDQVVGGYTRGFDPNQVYEFKRLGSDKISRYRMNDQHSAFNVCGLFWRLIDTSLSE